MSELIDTTEMYLRILFELEEEGVPLLRARIVERLGQSGPTVSQTVARMERDGLVRVAPDRRLELTEEGRKIAYRVMRKHRLVERLLTDVIGLDWALVHEEACRWEHVVSAEVEQRIVAMIEPPFVSPYGNPIPLLEELGQVTVPYPDSVSLAQYAKASGRGTVAVARLCEHLQDDPELLGEITGAEIFPGRQIEVVNTEVGVQVNGSVISADVVEHIHVIPVGV